MMINHPSAGLCMAAATALSPKEEMEHVPV
jgi:hypothetical protein